MKRIRIIVLLALSTSGCGYALSGRGSFLPDYIRTIGIPPLVNNSTFFQVEQTLTEKIRAEFIGRGRYTVLPEPEGADAVVTGAVTSISVQPVGFTDQQLASRYLFLLTMKVEFTDARTNQVTYCVFTLLRRECSAVYPGRGRKKCGRRAAAFDGSRVEA